MPSYVASKPSQDPSELLSKQIVPLMLKSFIGVGVGVGVDVGFGVEVGIGIGVDVGFSVGVGVRVGIRVGVGVGVKVGIGVGVGVVKLGVGVTGTICPARRISGPISTASEYALWANADAGSVVLLHLGNVTPSKALAHK